MRSKTDTIGWTINEGMDFGLKWSKKCHSKTGELPMFAIPAATIFGGASFLIHAETA